MKTVRIPKWNNPFVVYVNNRKYSYPAGTIQIVPNEVADAINNVIINMPKEKDSTSIIEAVNELKGEVDALKAAYNPENVITEDVFLHELDSGIYTVKGKGKIKLYKPNETSSINKVFFANGVIVIESYKYTAIGFIGYESAPSKSKALINGSCNAAGTYYTNTIDWKEDKSNKTTTITTTGAGSDTKYPSEKAVKSYVASVLSDS